MQILHSHALLLEFKSQCLGRRLELHGEAHVDARIVDHAVAIGDLVGAERAADARRDGDDLVILLHQALVPQALQEIPDTLDVLVLKRHIRLLEVNPVAHALREVIPVFDVGKHALAAQAVELFHLRPGRAVIAPVPAHFLLDADLHGQAVRVPAALARDVKTLHGFEAREQILKSSSEDMVHRRLTVGGWRPLVKHEFPSRSGFLARGFKDLLRLPELEDA